MQATAKALSPSESRPVLALSFCAAVLALLAVAALGASPAAGTGGAATKFAAGHFACYPAKLAGGQKPNVKLKNQFGSGSALVTATRSLCTPAKKNTTPMQNPSAHLTCYGLTNTHGPTGSKLVEITNQFGIQQMKVGLSPPDSLCLPSAKTTAATAPLGAVPTNLDHYLCYLVKPTKPFDQRIVTVTDQFGTSKDTVITPRVLCAPTSKNGGHVLSQTTHLLCYEIKSPTPGKTVYVRNQFGVLKGRLGIRSSLCLPSTKKVL